MRTQVLTFEQLLQQHPQSLHIPQQLVQLPASLWRLELRAAYALVAHVERMAFAVQELEELIKPNLAVVVRIQRFEQRVDRPLRPLVAKLLSHRLVELDVVHQHGRARVLVE